MVNFGLWQVSVRCVVQKDGMEVFMIENYVHVS